jgi:D-tyrosyl-tRNA(Tyr) deacylase
VRAVVQRVTEARVRIGDPSTSLGASPSTSLGASPSTSLGAGRIVGEIGRGLVVLLGIGRDDGPEDAAYVAAKIRDIRVFEGDAGRHMDRSVVDVGGSILVVSQFTLFGDIRKGRRPAFDAAAPPEQARALYESLVRELRAAQLPVATGEFQAMMRVELVNDGPVTILIDSKRQF